MLKRSLLFGEVIFAICLAVSTVHAQPTITNVTVGTAFRYQGAVRGVFPFSSVQTGTLQFQFSLWDDPVNTNASSQLASNILTTLNVSNGFFSTMLDFGDVFYGQRAFLEVSVYAQSNIIFPPTTNWVTVTPRTEIGAVPYAMWALKGGKQVLRSEGGNVGLLGNFGEIDLYSAFALTGKFNFEVVTGPKVIDEARILVGGKYWYDSPPPCLNQNFTISLEVWSATNILSSSPYPHSETFMPQFIRTLSTTNLVVGTVPVGEWLSLSLLTNSVQKLNPGEQLSLVSRVSAACPGNLRILMRGEVVIRDAP